MNDWNLTRPKVLGARATEAERSYIKELARINKMNVTDMILRGLGLLEREKDIKHVGEEYRLEKSVQNRD